MDQRVSRLEGAYEQVDRRLGGIEGQITGLRASIEAQRVGLESQISGLGISVDGLRDLQDKNLRWVIGLILTSWLTLMATLLLRH